RLRLLACLLRGDPGGRRPRGRLDGLLGRQRGRGRRCFIGRRCALRLFALLRDRGGRRCRLSRLGRLRLRRPATLRRLRGLLLRGSLRPGSGLPRRLRSGLLGLLLFALLGRGALALLFALAGLLPLLVAEPEHLVLGLLGLLAFLSLLVV